MLSYLRPGSFSLTLALILLFLPLLLTSQANELLLSGTVRDAKTGEELIGASILVKNLPGTGTVTNAYGFFSLKIPAGQNELLVRYLGYLEQIILLKPAQTVLDLRLMPETEKLKEVEISGRKSDDNLRSAQMGVVAVEMKEINKLPVIFGERDLLKSIQLLPGVQPAGEGNSGFYVRGGSSDQNLILLDEAPVYNAAHLLGFFSTFNSDAIRDAQLFKGNAPAEYGGRVSSVLDVRMKEGNDQQYQLSGGIGLITSRLNVEGPIVKDRGSFLVSGRTTYAELFLKLSNRDNLKDARLNFFDINAKANYRINQQNRIFLSGYFGRDHFSPGPNFGIKYGNSTATLRWNHVFNQRLFSNTSFLFNDFKYTVSLNNVGLDVKSAIRDFAVKEDLDWFLNNRHKLKFGLLSTFHTIVPGEITATDSSKVNPFSLSKSYGWENAVYAQHQLSLLNKITIQWGLRLSVFSVTGPGNQFLFSPSGKTDTLHLNTGQFGKTYFNPEPRFSASYLFYREMSFKVAYSRNTQTIQQLTNTTTANPTDRWVLSSNNIRPQISDQVSAGYYLNFAKSRYEFSVEGYFKWMQHQIDYKDGAVLRANETVEKELVYGVGKAYGVEVFLKKRSGRFTGWISYTWSSSMRKAEEINNGQWFHSRFDRTHDLSVVLLFDITPKINIGAVFTYYTGNAVTYPGGKYSLDGNVVSYYGLRNQDRMPDYHRLDLSANFILKQRKNWSHDLNVSLYNAYGFKNTYSIEFKSKDAANNVSVAEKTYLFRWVPSITYNFRFTAVKKTKAVSHE